MMKDPNWKPLEIEDLWQLGKAKNYCPYYAQQNQAGEADLIFMPYNYLMEDFSHEQSSLSLENAILIIDEAHNIQSFAEEKSNFEISVTSLKDCLKELDWMSTGQAKDVPIASLEVVRTLINHWIRFI